MENSSLEIRFLILSPFANKRVATLSQSKLLPTPSRYPWQSLSLPTPWQGPRRKALLETAYAWNIDFTIYLFTVFLLILWSARLHRWCQTAFFLNEVNAMVWTIFQSWWSDARLHPPSTPFVLAGLCLVKVVPFGGDRGLSVRKSLREK